MPKYKDAPSRKLCASSNSLHPWSGRRYEALLARRRALTTAAAATLGTFDAIVHRVAIAAEAARSPRPASSLRRKERHDGDE